MVMGNQFAFLWADDYVYGIGSHYDEEWRKSGIEIVESYGADKKHFPANGLL